MCFAHLAQILSGKYIIFDTMQKMCAEMRVIMAIAADAKIQYDTYAKRLLAQKSILANILVKTVAEFKDMKLLC